MEKVTVFDLANHIETQEDANFYLNDALETGDIAYIKGVLTAVAKAQSKTQLAKEAGISRQALYHALSDKGNPTMETFFAMVKALGLRLSVQQAA